MNIASISDHKVTRNDEICRLLREALEMAERGEFTAIAVAGILISERSFTSASSCNSVASLVGVLEYMKHRMLTRHDQE